MQAYRRFDGLEYAAGSKQLLETAIPTVPTEICSKRHPNGNAHACARLERQLFHTALVLLAIVLPFLASPAVAQTQETNWRLLRGRDIAPARTGMPQLTVKGEAVFGTTGCNSFSSTLTRQSDGRIRIDRPALTRKFCGGKQQGIENAFVDALGHTEFLSKLTAA